MIGRTIEQQPQPNWTGRLLKELLTGILDAEDCKWDIVWFNVGNWDITPATGKFIRKNPDWGFKDGEAKTSLADYEENLGELVRRIRAHSPKAMIPELEKDRDLGHPKSRAKGKKKKTKK